MLPLILFGCVVGVGVLCVFAMISAGLKELKRTREERRRERALAERVAEAARIRAERAAKAAAAAAPVPAVAPMGAGLEGSPLFAPTLPPPPPAARRLAKGSVPIPVRDEAAAAPAPRTHAPSAPPLRTRLVA